MGPFDRIVASADPGMIVVTTVAADDGEQSGCLVGFHSQSSIDPERYVVWLSKANHTCGVAARAQRLAVHWLTVADADVAAHFGSLSGDDVDKFAGVTWTDGGDGLPLLDRLPNRLVGRLHRRVDELGDHVGHVLEIESADCDARFPPLRFTAVRDLDPGHDA